MTGTVDSIKEGMLNELRRLRKELTQQNLQTKDLQEWNRFEVLYWRMPPVFKTKVHSRVKRYY